MRHIFPPYVICYEASKPNRQHKQLNYTIVIVDIHFCVLLTISSLHLIEIQCICRRQITRQQILDLNSRRLTIIILSMCYIHGGITAVCGRVLDNEDIYSKV